MKDINRCLTIYFMLAILIFQTVASFYVEGDQGSKISYRLPDNLLPEYYRVDIITNLADLNQNFTFEGKVWIQVGRDT